MDGIKTADEDLIFKAWLADATSSSGCVWTTTKPEYITRLAREYKAVLAEREKNPGVWDGAPENAASATIIYRTEKSIPCSYGKEFYRDLPKTRAREIAERISSETRIGYAMNLADIIESAINEALKDN